MNTAVNPHFDNNQLIFSQNDFCNYGLDVWFCLIGFELVTKSLLECLEIPVALAGAAPANQFKFGEHWIYGLADKMV